MSGNVTPTIRPATRDDAGEIHALHTRSITTLCAEVYSNEMIAALLKDRTLEGYHDSIDKGDMFVCSIDDKIVGFLHAVPGEVVAVFVDAGRDGQGIGSVLFRRALEIAARGHEGPIKLVSTLNAEGFYAKHGFVPVKKSTVSRNEVEIPVVEMELRSV